MMMIFAAGPKN